MLKTSLFITGGTIIAILWHISPIVKLFPKPTGPYIVGTTIDENCSMIILPTISHSDFDDLVFLKWPLRSWSNNPYFIMTMINKSIMQFLNRYIPI